MPCARRVPSKVRASALVGSKTNPTRKISMWIVTSLLFY